MTFISDLPGLAVNPDGPDIAVPALPYPALEGFLLTSVQGAEGDWYLLEVN